MRHGDLPKVILAVYIVLLMLPIYWLINMSFETNSEIMTAMAHGRTSRPSRNTPKFSTIRPGAAASASR